MIIKSSIAFWTYTKTLEKKDFEYRRKQNLALIIFCVQSRKLSICHHQCKLLLQLRGNQNGY